MQLSSILDLGFFSQRSDPPVIELAVGDIYPNRYQPRSDFDSSELLALAKSISQVGILQPPAVRKTNGGYELICGERRLRAAKLAGLSTIPCMVCELSECEAAAAALAENLQRRDLNCFEQAEGFSRLIEEFGMTQKQLAVTLGISQPSVANKLRLLKLDEGLRSQLLRAGLSERHARALLTVDEDNRREVLSAVIERGLTVGEMECYIAELKETEKKRQSYKRRARSLGDVRLFFNTVEKAVSVMRLAGVSAETERRQEDGYIEYVIKIVPRGTI